VEIDKIDRHSGGTAQIAAISKPAKSGLPMPSSIFEAVIGVTKAAEQHSGERQILQFNRVSKRPCCVG
jgi:hypothetical protein